MITLIMRPRGNGRFDVEHDGRLLFSTRQPLLDGARTLRDQGHDPDTLLTARHHDRPWPSFVPKPIGELAKWTIEESDRDGLRWRRWRSPEDRENAARRAGYGPPASADLDPDARHQPGPRAAL